MRTIQLKIPEVPGAKSNGKEISEKKTGIFSRMEKAMVRSPVRFLVCLFACLLIAKLTKFN